MLIGNKCYDCGWCDSYNINAQSFIETAPTFESTTDKENSLVFITDCLTVDNADEYVLLLSVCACVGWL